MIFCKPSRMATLWRRILRRMDASSGLAASASSFFGDDGGKNPLFEVFVRRDLGKEDVEVIFHALAVGIRLCLPRAFEDACHAQKLLRAQAATPDCAVHACAHITYPGKTGRTFEGNHAAGGARLLLKQPDFVCVGQRLRFEALFFPGGGTRLIGKKAKHLVKL